MNSSLLQLWNWDLHGNGMNFCFLQLIYYYYRDSSLPKSYNLKIKLADLKRSSVRLPLCVDSWFTDGLVVQKCIGNVPAAVGDLTNNYSSSAA